MPDSTSPSVDEPPLAGGTVLDGAPASAASAVDDSCSTASLLQYYDDCAEWYDHTDEGAEDTYICVDRVTASMLRAFGMPPPMAIKVAPRAVAVKAELFASSAVVTVIPSAESPGPDELTMSVATLSCDGPTHTGSPAADDSSSSPSTPQSTEEFPSSPRSPSPSSLSSELASGLGAASSPSPSPSPAPAVDTAAATIVPAASVPLCILDLGVGTGLASRPLFANFSSPRMIVPRRSSAGEPRLAVPSGTLLPSIWGVDLSPNMLKVSSVLPFVHLIVADVNTNLRDPAVHPSSPLASSVLPVGYFDAVVCVGTSEFVHDLGHFLDQVASFLRPAGGIFVGTFPSNQTRTYPHMTHTSVEELTRLAEQRDLEVKETQQYRGWSVSSEEHVEYIQITLRKR